MSAFRIGELIGIDEKTGQETRINIYSNTNLIIGRDKRSCGVVIDDPTISNKHLHIYTIIYDQSDDGQISPLVYAEDRSSNGTLWNRTRMKGTTLLSNGDLLQLAIGISVVYLADYEEKTIPFRERQVPEIEAFGKHFAVSTRPIGVGGYGTVYCAFDQKKMKQVACKVLDRRAIKEKLFRMQQVNAKDARSIRSKLKLYDREAEVLQALNHPNIINVERIYKSPNTIYIFEELVTGGDLFSYLEFKGGKLPEVEVAVIVRQVAEALNYLHNRDIVHRDLKPDNVLMTSLNGGSRVVLADFGCARPVGSRESKQTRMHTVTGTKEYMAPEIRATAAENGYTKSVDMWSLGCLTTVLLTGGSPFADSDSLHYSEPLARAGNLAALEADPDWVALGVRPKDFVRRLLTVDPTRRPSVREALEHDWFTNRAYRAALDEVYARAMCGWRPPRAGAGMFVWAGAGGWQLRISDGGRN